METQRPVLCDSNNKLKAPTRSVPLHVAPSSIDCLSDDELLHLISRIDEKNDAVGVIPEMPMLSPPVYRLKPYPILVKHARTETPHEAFTMEYVRHHTSIHVPRVHRMLPHPSNFGFWIVMDYIDGDCLLTVWHTLSWWRQLQVIFTLRSYVQQLRKVPLPDPGIPGPFDGTGKPLSCYGGHFGGDGQGPFADYASMAAWHDYQNYRAQVGFQMKGAKNIMRYSRFDTSSPLVLCHFDLHMRNIMLDKDNRVWLIDWGFAGAYPPWFEYTSQAAWSYALNPNLRLPSSFARFTSFITGHYYWYYKHYTDRLIVLIETFQYFPIDDEYFVKLGIDSSLFRPVGVARPPLLQRIAHTVLDTVYSLAVGVRNVMGAF